MASEQERQLARVSSRIERAVVMFVVRIPMGGEFNGADLDRWVCGQAACTPGSATRILRSLRKKGLLNYTIANRARAEYRREPLETVTQLDMFGGAE
jgi:hypothetical protein